MVFGPILHDGTKITTPCGGTAIIKKNELSRLKAVKYRMRPDLRRTAKRQEERVYLASFMFPIIPLIAEYVPTDPVMIPMNTTTISTGYSADDIPPARPYICR